MKQIRLSYDEKAGKPIDRLIFGSFIEHIENCIRGGICDPGNPASDAAGLRLDVLEQCRSMGPSVLRFPGGTVIGLYHWQDHVGPLNERKRARNLVWGGMLSHQFGTCEYIDLCRKLGAQPMLCVNMPTGTPQEAAAWVEYCNGTAHSCYADLRRKHGYEEPFGVHYWCIGNECFAHPDIGQQDDPQTYVREAWEYAKLMKLTDPTIELVFVGNSMDEAWNRTVLDGLWEICDYLSFHYYASSGNAFNDLSGFEQDFLSPAEKLLAEYNVKELHFDRWYRFPPRHHEIRIALDEWNIWDSEADSLSPYGLQERYTWRDALWTASFFHMMFRHGDTVRLAAMAQMVNVLAPVIAEANSAWRQTIWYPFALYSRYSGSQGILCHTNDPETEAVMTVDGEKRTFFIINRSAAAKELVLPEHAVTAVILWSDDLMGRNSREHDIVHQEEKKVDNKAFITLKPYSIHMIVSQT